MLFRVEADKVQTHPHLAGNDDLQQVPDGRERFAASKYVVFSVHRGWNPKTYPGWPFAAKLLRKVHGVGCTCSSEDENQSEQNLFLFACSHVTTLDFINGLNFLYHFKDDAILTKWRHQFSITFDAIIIFGSLFRAITLNQGTTTCDACFKRIGTVVIHAVNMKLISRWTKRPAKVIV
jgi:hypothetical protein